MQGFTLGGRPELTARLLSPIQVNYLIFPGTSGASFMHYLVGDKYVTPPEHAEYYTEKLAILPQSYQINFYKRHIESNMDFELNYYDFERRRALRRENGLCEDCFVFANFNKQDKIEPNIFNTWCDILKSVPGSVLWLLEPSHRYKESGIKENLYTEAMSRGIKKDRIRFAKRVDKRNHLLRVNLADLFLDSFLYGAHSTATDSLRGGLPVLSVGGGSFARRVGITLLETMSKEKGAEDVSNYLLVGSMKDFGDTAVLLGREVEDKLTMGKIKRGIKAGWESVLFDTESYARAFEKMAKGMFEIYTNKWQGNEYMNLLV